MKTLLIILCLIVGLSGCALNPEYQASLDSWVGAPVVDFFAEHREPDSMIDMIDYRIYVWDSTLVSTVYVPGNTVCTAGVSLPMGGTTAPYCTTYGGGAYSGSSSCAWKLRVRDNVITEVELLGDSCNENERPVSRPADSPIRSRGGSTR